MITLIEILKFLGDIILNVYGMKDNMQIGVIGNLNCVEKNALGWIATYKTDKQKLAECTTLKYIICDNTITYTKNIAAQDKVLIVTNNPRLAFIMIAETFFQKDINSTDVSHIDSTAVVMTNHIGKRCIIHPHVVIYKDVIIGDDVIIQAGTIIGNNGLGCERDGNGFLHKFPHYGRVIIGNDIDIGPNCQIVKGTLGDTIIGDGTRIDGLCSIGHNSRIGRNNWIASSVMIAGSVSIGDNNTIFAATNIRDQISIGDNNIIGMGTIQTKNIGNRELWYGIPGIKIKDL